MAMYIQMIYADGLISAEIPLNSLKTRYLFSTGNASPGDFLVKTPDAGAQNR